MGYPVKLLNPGEELVLDLRQHWIALTAAILWTLVVVVATALLAWLVSNMSWAMWIVILVGVVAFFALAGWRYATWATTYFVLTTQRVISRSGVFAKRALDIPLDSINDIHFTQTILERMFGSGNLIISSASEFGNNEFRFIRDPERVQNLIYHQREEDERRERMEQANYQAQAMAQQMQTQMPQQAAPGADIPTQIARLAALRDQGAITETEFQTKKAELLGRM